MIINMDIKCEPEEILEIKQEPEDILFDTEARSDIKRDDSNYRDTTLGQYYKFPKKEEILYTPPNPNEDVSQIPMKFELSAEITKVPTYSHENIENLSSIYLYANLNVTPLQLVKVENTHSLESHIEDQLPLDCTSGNSIKQIKLENRTISDSKGHHSNMRPREISISVPSQSQELAHSSNHSYIDIVKLNTMKYYPYAIGDQINYSQGIIGSEAIQFKSRMSDPDYKPFACDLCDYRCKKLRLLNIHKQVHDDARPFACDQCDYTCKRIGNLKTHKLYHDDAKPYACDKCSYTSKQLRHLKQHKRVHEDAKPFACNVCNYTCRHLSTLKTHRLKHSDFKPFACTECDYRSKHLSALKLHKMDHDTIKPFACDVCNYQCKQLSNLKQHKVIHEESNTFSCDVCNYTCKHLRHLKRHKIVHGVESPYTCDQCSYISKYSSNLKVHKLKHSNV